MQTVDPRQLQISLTGFLEKNTSLFCKVRLPARSLVARRCLAHACTLPLPTGRAPLRRAPRRATPPLLVQELWQLLISANQTGTGIPQRFLDEKAEELRRQKEEQERVQVGPPLAAKPGSLPAACCAPCLPMSRRESAGSMPVRCPGQSLLRGGPCSCSACTGLPRLPAGAAPPPAPASAAVVA